MAPRTPTLKPWHRRSLWGVGIVIWLGVLFGVAVPSWRRAVQQHRQVEEVANRLEVLDNWVVAGIWLEQTLAPRQQAIDPQWRRLFPADPAKGQLFLDLARVADRSGVEEFKLRELTPADGVVVADAADGGPVPLTAYRVRANFRGQYAQVARFLGGLKRIERALSVHNLEIKPAHGAVQVDLELDVYVGSADQS